jgi:hypothetical protein
MGSEQCQKIAQAVTRRVEAELSSAKPVTTFEIQLVQNINTSGYFDAERQHKVDAFGAAVYTAIGRVIDQLSARDIQVASYAIVGSNGTKVLAANVDHVRRHGKTYLQGVDLFDGRAFMTPVKHLIKAVGQEYVRIFNTKADWPAPYTPFGVRSIANFDTVADLKEMFPRLKTYVLVPKVRVPNPLLSHIAGMSKHDTLFSVQEYIGHGFLRTLGPKDVHQHDLMPVWRGERWTYPLDGVPTHGALKPRPPSSRLQTGRPEVLAPGNP